MHKSTFIFLIIIPLLFGTAGWAQNSVRLDWQTLTPLPQPVGGHMSVWSDGALFVIGGASWKDGAKSILSDVWAYSPKTKIWRHEPSLPQPVAYGAAQKTVDGIEIEGGLNHDKTLSGVYRFLRNTHRWEQEKDLPLPLAYAGGGAIHGKIFLAGGAADLQKNETYNSFLWQRGDNQWRQTAKIPGAPRALFASASTRRGLYLFGGMTYQNNSVQNLADAWFFDVKNNSWKSLHPLPTAARGMAACAVSDQYILLAGGYSDNYLNRVLLYDVQRNTYSELTPLPRALMGFAMVYAKGCVYVTGGEGAPQQRSKQFFGGKMRWQNTLK